jgi:hypothetical protein
MKKRLQKIAHRIVELEKEIECQPTKQYFDEMEKLMFGLSIKDMIEIDNYIQEKKLLTK